MKYEIDGVTVRSEIEGFTIDCAEYVLKHIRNEEKSILPICNVQVYKNDEGDWEIDYWLEMPKFERIRRITGYLVGTMDRWNDAKRCEESERVKHM